MAEASPIKVQRIDDYRWRIPRTGEMRVDGLVFASAAMMRDLQEDRVCNRWPMSPICQALLGTRLPCLISTGDMASPLVGSPPLTSTKASSHLGELATISIEGCGCWAQV